jgi:NADH-quinone oxidoreductase subunit C
MDIRDVRDPIATNYGDHAQRFAETWTSQIEALKAKFGQAIEEVRTAPSYPTDMPIIYVRRDSLIEVLAHAKSDPAFDYGFLSDLTATDEQAEPRFEVVYQLYSMSRHNRIRFKVRVPENVDVPTLTGLWAGANWPEREVWDMFGIKFRGHPDLRRILMDERWVGHPLRKDYPLRGYQVFSTAEPVHPELLEDEQS